MGENPSPLGEDFSLSLSLFYAKIQKDFSYGLRYKVSFSMDNEVPKKDIERRVSEKSSRIDTRSL